MWINIITIFLIVSILLYCLLGGADFGAGILEIFSGNQYKAEQQELISHAMGPVWEANHMWLILAVVIFFNGFPRAYSHLTTTYHIPLTLMLIGVILRGCSFTFRHYDAIQGKSQRYYTWAFCFSSVITPLMIGTLAGAVFLGKVPPVGGGFHESYISPWLNSFSFSVGIFTCVLFSFLASVYLVSESATLPLQKLFSKRAQNINLLAVMAGALVFLSAHWDGLNLVQMFWADPISMACVGLSTLLLAPIWLTLKRQHRSAPLLAGAQVVLILVGWLKLQFPVLLQTRDSNEVIKLTLFNSAAPEATLKYLGLALLVGGALIFPALIYLLRIFKRRPRLT